MWHDHCDSYDKLSFICPRALPVHLAVITEASWSWLRKCTPSCHSEPQSSQTESPRVPVQRTESTRTPSPSGRAPSRGGCFTSRYVGLHHDLVWWPQSLFRGTKGQRLLWAGSQWQLTLPTAWSFRTGLHHLKIQSIKPGTKMRLSSGVHGNG